ncbi:riboflavin synthase [uncultured Limosilactobacillus sp.]|uniref:riboflavin synthase n=1 Tax=uncultured Limosilactobacillus sp. TaxID=2837629 RepID=UPI0025F3349A|nr:riboflavin synthase [uncultured Limosilactobacillus sp.]
MFTGLIEGMGTIKAIERVDETITMQITAPAELLATYQIGDSMAIDGTCLTAVQKTANAMTVELMPATYERTSFKNRKVGDQVNLERALAANGRFEGHLVSGHVDFVSQLVKRQGHDNALELTFSIDDPYAEQIISQGSVAINGVSLTVMTSDGYQFTIGLIPHTQEKTNLASLTVGDQVNIETDLMGKYLINHLNRRKENGR